MRVRVIRASLRLSLKFDFPFFERGGVEGISHSAGVAVIVYHTVGTLKKCVRHTIVITLFDFQTVSFLSEACLVKEIDVSKEYGAPKSKHVFRNNIRIFLEGDKHVDEKFMDPHILRDVSDRWFALRCV